MTIRTGKLLAGDCLLELQKIDPSSVDLIYLDPPFFSQKEHRLRPRDNSALYSFEDRWNSTGNYVKFIKSRLIACRKVLKDTGSIFLHCNKYASHHLRLALDDVFGENNFQSEIVWIYRRWSNSRKGLLDSHQTIYFYSKTSHFRFNKIFEGYSPTTNIDQIFQARSRNSLGKPVYKTDQDGKNVLLKTKLGVPLSDVWEIPYLNPKARERVGYPTQKPIILLEKIIKLVTNEGDLVLDPFCGSGTTLVAAKLLNRKFIGIDVSADAIALSRDRLEKPVRTESALLLRGKDAYINQDDHVTALLGLLGAVPVQRNKGIDGFLREGDTIKPVPIRIQRYCEPYRTAVEQLLKACVRNSFKVKILFKDYTSQGVASAPNEYANDGLIVVDDIKDFISNRAKYIDPYSLHQ